MLAARLTIGFIIIFVSVSQGLATVFEYDPDGTVRIGTPVGSRPPDLEHLGTNSSYRTLADHVALQYAGSTGVRASGLDALQFTRLFRSLIQVESGFDPTAVSHAGAMGLGQLMPGTARALGVTDPFDPVANLDGAARYFTRQLERFDGRIDLALAAYNAGPARVEAAGGIPPIAETVAFVAAVTEAAGLPAQPPVPTGVVDIGPVLVFETTSERLEP